MRHDTSHEIQDRWGLILAGGDGTRLRPLTRGINTESEAETFSAVYTRIPSVDFSERVLAPRAANLAVLEVTGTAWSDLGDPGRVMTVLTRARIEPEWARPAVVPA